MTHTGARFLRDVSTAGTKPRLISASEEDSKLAGFLFVQIAKNGFYLFFLSFFWTGSTGSTAL